MQRWDRRAATALAGAFGAATLALISCVQLFGPGDALTKAHRAERRGEWDEAVAAYDEALRQPGGGSAFTRADLAAAREQAAVRHRDLAAELLDAGRYDDAVAELRRAAALQPDESTEALLLEARHARDVARADAHVEAGLAALEAGDERRGQARLRLALALDPGRSDAREALTRTNASAAAAAAGPSPLSESATHRGAPTPHAEPASTDATPRGADATPLRGRKLYESRIGSVVMVETANATGSGVVVAPGLVVTNAHVLSSALGVVTTAQGQQVPFSESWKHPFADVAVIRAVGLEAEPAPIGAGRDLRPGDPVSVIGSPQGLAFSYSDGAVAAVGRSVDGYTQMIQFTAPISMGSSGGPIFDERGRLAGLASLFMKKGQLLNFAVPIEYALELLKELGLG